MKVPARIAKLNNGDEVILRSPEPKDAGALLTMLRKMFHESYRNFNGPGDRFDTVTVEKQEERLEANLSLSTSFFLSAFKGEKVIGNLNIGGKENLFNLHCGGIGMGVLVEYHGLGVGYELLKYAIEVAQSIGLKRLVLKVRTHNVAGIALYEKCGFRRVGRLEMIALIDGEFYDEFLYEKLI